MLHKSENVNMEAKQEVDQKSGHWVKVKLSPRDFIYFQPRDTLSLHSSMQRTTPQFTCSSEPSKGYKSPILIVITK